MTSFSLAYLTPNFLTVSMAVVSLAILACGIWVLSLNRFSRLHRDFFILCCFLTAWLAFEALTFSATRVEEGVPLAHVIWAIVLFISPATFALNMSVLGYRWLRDRLVPILYIVALAFLPTVLLPSFVGPVHSGIYPYAPVPGCGPVNFTYLLIFAATFVGIYILHFKKMSGPDLSPREHGIRRLTFLATVFGSLGILDWIQCYNINVPPFGCFPILVWIALYAFAIYRYRLFQLTLSVAAPAIVEALPGALFVADAAGTVVITNQGAKTMTGLGEGSLLGRDVRGLLPAASEVLERVLRGSNSDGLETALRAGGRDVPVSLSAQAIRRPDGSPDGAILIAVEISKLKEQVALIERQKEELAKAADEMSRTQKMLAGREGRLTELENELAQIKKSRS